MKEVSTTELIYNLREGQRAKALVPFMNLVVEKDRYGSIIVIEDDLSDKFVGKPLPLSGAVLKAKWEIERIEVTLAEALNHLKDGKPVTCEVDGWSDTYDSIYDSISFREIADGKWFLED